MTRCRLWHLSSMSLPMSALTHIPFLMVFAQSPSLMRLSAAARVSESERPLSVGGSGVIDISHFLPLYIYSPGSFAPGRNHGSNCSEILRLSCSSTHSTRQTIRSRLQLWKWVRKGLHRFRTVPLAPRRDVRKIEGRFEEVMRGPGSDGSKEDYISVCLTDREAIWDAMESP